MIDSSLSALGLLLALGVNDTVESALPPYHPWKPDEPLPLASLPPEDTNMPAREGPTRARRPLQLGAGVGVLPLECVPDDVPCTSHSGFIGLAWRLFPHFAWTLGAERSRIAEQAIHYMSVGARVFALDAGNWDPYLELNLGGEHWGSVPGINLAGEVGFGVAVHVSEKLRVASALKLRHGVHQLSTCAAYRHACHWSAVGERWLAAGLQFEVVFGPPH